MAADATSAIPTPDGSSLAPFAGTKDVRTEPTTI
jgi:hypothetical protein